MRSSAGPDVVDRLRPPRWHHAGNQLRLLAAQLAAEGALVEGRLLDMGCGARPYASLFPRVDYLGIDLVVSPHGTPDLFAESESLPVRSCAFDVVLSTQQLEHVSDPAQVLDEAHRVLRPGGRLLLSTHGVWVHHPDPIDLWRWTEEGLGALVAAHGFRIERMHRQGGLVAAAGVLLTYPLSAVVTRAGSSAAWLRAVLTVVQTGIAFVDRVVERRLPRHYAAPSYLVVALRQNDEGSG